MIGQRNEGIFAVIEGIVAGVGEKLGGAAHALSGALGGAGAEAGESSGRGIMDHIRGVFGADEKGSEVAAAAPARGPELQQAVSKGVHDFDPAELGTMAPQMFSAAVGGQGRASGGVGM